MKKKNTKKASAKKEKIVSYSLEEIRRMPDMTDIKRLKKMKEEDIDFSDIPELGDWFWDNAVWVNPAEKNLKGKLLNKADKKLEKEIKNFIASEKSKSFPLLHDFFEEFIESRV
jgi:hypothetical protein